MITTIPPVTDIVRSRFSCRSYRSDPIPVGRLRELQSAIDQANSGPLGTPLRFNLIAATGEDNRALRGLGTYGYIKNPAGFLVGVMPSGEKNLEDFGYRMEQLILEATRLEIGTCWLGGSFTRSSFARRVALSPEERIPAVTSLGLIADEAKAKNTLIRQQVGADQRLPWQTLFYDKTFQMPLAAERAGAYATPLEMVRLGPSASNKQPWRIVQDKNAFHFYLKRTPGYRDSILQRLLSVEDLQRVDIGIAMCHFELSARELGLPGRWQIQDPGKARLDGQVEYIISWITV